MPDSWVKGAERINGPKSGAPYREAGVPWRVVWHTMEAPEDDPNTPADEGWSLSQARSYIAGHQWPPHLWALYLHDHVFQTVALDKAAYALVHDWSGYPETNHAHAIQIEVMGYANQGIDDPGLCEWLGRRVLRPIIDAGVPVDLSNLAASTGSDGYGTSGAVRMSNQSWYAFDGLCGHANVPKNSHWDPGKARYDLIAQGAGGEDDMANSDEIYKQTTEILKALRYDPADAGTEDEVGLRIKRTDEKVADMYTQTTEILKALRFDPTVANTEDDLGARVKRTEEQVAEILGILKAGG